MYCRSGSMKTDKQHRTNGDGNVGIAREQQYNRAIARMNELKKRFEGIEAGRTLTPQQHVEEKQTGRKSFATIALEGDWKALDALKRQ